MFGPSFFACTFSFQYASHQEKYTNGDLTYTKENKDKYK
jgi:hypothetical protein|tara:strand:- start:21378 stop:21494 length:117 start_codon:yes stop_codon:yes gene_type:complete